MIQAWTVGSTVMVYLAALAWLPFMVIVADHRRCGVSRRLAHYERTDEGATLDGRAEHR